MVELRIFGERWVRLRLLNQHGAFTWGCDNLEVKVPEHVRVRWPNGRETIERTEKRRQFTTQLTEMGSLRPNLIESTVEVLVLKHEDAEVELMLDRVDVCALAEKETDGDERKTR
jgi:hypothetical protein